MEIMKHCCYTWMTCFKQVKRSRSLILKRKVVVEFEMKDLGTMHNFLGLEVWQKPREIMLSQGKYVVEILKRFGTMDCKSMTTSMKTNLKLFGDTTSERVDATLYSEMIGSLMYLTNTRPDICFAVCYPQILHT